MIGIIALCVAVVALALATFVYVVLGKLIKAFKEMADDLLEWAKSLESETDDAITAARKSIAQGGRRTDHRFKL